MSEQIKKEEVIETKKEETKVNVFKKAWGYIVTGITCVAVSVGVMLGADVNKVQDTLTKAQAKQVAVIAATYSAEQVVSKLGAVVTSEKKMEIIKEIQKQVETEYPTFVEAIGAVKETVKEVAETVKDVKEQVVSEKETKEVKETKKATEEKVVKKQLKTKKAKKVVEKK